MVLIPGSSQPSSSTPDASAQRASEAADEAEAAAAAARRAANVAAKAAKEAEPEVKFTTDPSEYPPPPNLKGDRFFVTRDFPGVPDGIHTVVSLKNAGVDPDKTYTQGRLQSWVGETGSLRKSKATGNQQTVIYWW